MKTIIIASYALSVLNFRKELVKKLLAYGEFIVLAPDADTETIKNIEKLGAVFESVQLQGQSTNLLANIKSQRAFQKK